MKSAKYRIGQVVRGTAFDFPMVLPIEPFPVTGVIEGVIVGVANDVYYLLKNKDDNEMCQAAEPDVFRIENVPVGWEPKESK